VTSPGFLDFTFLALRDLLGLGEVDEGVVSSQVGGARCQKGVVNEEAGPVLKEYPSCVLQEEGEARLGDEFAGKKRLPLYVPMGDTGGILGVIVGPGRVQRAPRCCRFRGTLST
jgi:hypothetical protein